MSDDRMEGMKRRAVSWLDWEDLSPDPEVPIMIMPMRTFQDIIRIMDRQAATIERMSERDE